MATVGAELGQRHDRNLPEETLQILALCSIAVLLRRDAQLLTGTGGVLSDGTEAECGDGLGSLTRDGKGERLLGNDGATWMGAYQRAIVEDQVAIEPNLFGDGQCARQAARGRQHQRDAGIVQRLYGGSGTWSDSAGGIEERTVEIGGDEAK